MMENYEEFTNQKEKIIKSSTMYNAIYMNNLYEAIIINNKEIALVTQKPINETSKQNYGIYYTHVSPDECDAIYIEELYALYQKEIYKVIQVGGNFQNLMLEANDPIKFDKTAGFTVDFYTHSKPFAILKKEQVEKLLIKKNKLDISETKKK